MVPALQFILDWHHALIFSYAAFCAILIVYVSHGRMSASTSAIFIITSLCVLFVARMPVFAFNIALNPDESQMIANAKKYIFVDMNTWRSVDTGSSGPLNSMVLMWPVLGLGRVTYFSARLTGAFLIGATWLFTYLSLFRSIPQMRIFLAGMLMCFLAGTYFFDFVHYSSEHLPVALLAFSTYIVILALHSRVRRSLLIASALALGAIPFAKLQATPIAAVLGMMHVALISFSVHVPWKQRIGDLAVLGAALVPALAILVPLAASGNLSDFWVSYIEWSRAYIQAPLPFMVLMEMEWTDQFLHWYADGCILVIIAGVTLWAARVIDVDTRQAFMAGGAFLIFVVAMLTVFLPGRPFTHYLILLASPLALVAGTLWPRSSFLFTMRKFPILIGTAAACCFILATGLYASTPIRLNLTITAIEQPGNAGNVFAWNPPAEAGLLIWGWMPEWYAMSPFVPATREVTTYNQLVESPLKGYFRDRLIGDFKAHRPALVVDAVAPNSFFFKDPKNQGLQTFPELAGLVAAGYGAVTTSPDCPRIYIRNDLVPSWRNSFAKIRSIKASSYLDFAERSFRPELVDDWQTFEKCPDRWLLPDGKLGELSIELEQEETVRAVRILNTRNGPFGDRAARSATVRLLLHGNKVFETQTRIRRYPYWTTVSVPSLRADVVNIAVTAFEGRGGGLNEVKIVPVR